MNGSVTVVLAERSAAEAAAADYPVRARTAGRETREGPVKPSYTRIQCLGHSACAPFRRGENFEFLKGAVPLIRPQGL